MGAGYSSSVGKSPSLFPFGPTLLRSLPLVAVAFSFALGVASTAGAANAHLAYYGGNVVSNPQVVVVSWGNSVDATVANGMAGFYSTILQSPYLDWVSEYSTVGLTGVSDGLAGSNQHIGRGSFVGSFTIPALVATTVSNEDVLMQLQAQIGLGNLPAPTKDAKGNPNTLYMVNFPPGVTLVSFGGTTSCAAPPMGFCGATDSMPVGNFNVGVGFIPDQSPGSPCTGLCGTDSNYFNNASEVHAHVLLNLVTNVEYGLWSQAGTGVVARPVAWYDVGTKSQIADVCTGQPADVGGYTVEKGWSNTQGTCVSSPASTLPICTAGTTYCRQCDSTDVGQDGGCPAATAQCEMDNSNSAFGECVQCTGATNCTGTTPVCAKGGTANDSCRACAGDGECTTNAAGPHCTTSGACGPAPATSSSSSGCSSTGTSASALALVLGLLALALRRQSVR